MNTTLRYTLAIFLAGLPALMTGCGQTGDLFLPGHGTGYYKTHEFTQRPVHAAPDIHQHKDSAS